MSILDNSKILKAHGCDRALGLTLTQLSSLGEGDAMTKSTNNLAIENIVLVCGDLEATSAEIIKTWLSFQVPVEVVVGSNLPSYVSGKTLVVICDLSSTKLQLLDVIEQAKNLAARVELVTCKNKVSNKFMLDKTQIHALSDGLQLELISFRLVEVLLRLFVSYGFVSKHHIDELKEAFQQVSSDGQGWRASVPSADNLAKQLADDILGKTPIIYTGPATDSLKQKWKTSLNKLAKNLAWTSQHPGFDSIEWSGWTSHPVEKPFLPIFLISSFEDSVTLNNFEKVERTLSGRWHKPRVIHLSGKSLISQLVWASVLADASAIYLAALNGTKPLQVNR